MLVERRIIPEIERRLFGHVLQSLGQRLDFLVLRHGQPWRTPLRA
jgi:hypothetical protein